MFDTGAVLALVEEAMRAHDLLVDDAADGHVIQDVAELLPELDTVATLARTSRERGRHACT